MRKSGGIGDYMMHEAVPANETAGIKGGMQEMMDRCACLLVTRSPRCSCFVGLGPVSSCSCVSPAYLQTVCMCVLLLSLARSLPILYSSLGSRVIVDLGYFLIVLIVLLNIMFGIIIDTFSELRSAKVARLQDTTQRCFICGIDKNTFDRAATNISLGTTLTL